MRGRQRELSDEERSRRNSVICKRWREEKRKNGTLEQYEKDRYQKRRDSILLYAKVNKERINKQQRTRIATTKGNIKYLLRQAKGRAKKSKLLFNLTEEDIFIPDICPVFNIPLVRGNGKTIENSPSLDRIDSNLGYVKGNIMVMSHKANRLKNNATVEDLRLLLEFLEGLPCRPSTL